VKRTFSIIFAVNIDIHKGRFVAGKAKVLLASAAHIEHQLLG